MLSLATIALNEEAMIGGMLDSVRAVVDEIVVGVDSRTSDSTARIVAEHGGRAFPFRWTDDFSAARNQTLEQASGDWVLVIDPDERLTSPGRFMVRDVLDRIGDPMLADVDGFSFVANQCDLQEHVHATVRTSVRLFKHTMRYQGLVHEEVWKDGQPGTWLFVAGVPSITHFGAAPERWIGRGKHELYLRLLERRVAEHPEDEYARKKLAQEQRMDATGLVLA